MLEKAIKVAVKEGVKEKALSPNEKLIKTNKGKVSFSSSDVDAAKKKLETAKSSLNTQANMVWHNKAIGQNNLAKNAAFHIPDRVNAVKKAEADLKKIEEAKKKR